MVENSLRTSTISQSSGEDDDDGTFRSPDDPNDDFASLYKVSQNQHPDDDDDRLVIDEENPSPPKALTKDELLNYVPRSIKRGKLVFSFIPKAFKRLIQSSSFYKLIQSIHFRWFKEAQLQTPKEQIM